MLSFLDLFAKGFFQGAGIATALALGLWLAGVFACGLGG